MRDLRRNKDPCIELNFCENNRMCLNSNHYFSILGVFRLEINLLPTALESGKAMVSVVSVCVCLFGL